MAPRASAEELGGERSQSLPRRHFMTLLGVGSITAATGGSSVLFVQYSSPNVLYEPALFFNAGRPEDYDLGVSTRWVRKQKVWIVRTEEGIFALVAICTHLGCTPNWVPGEGVFHCPCHGSVFSVPGDVLKGPAPVPLYRAPIELNEAGEMIVGTGLLGYARAEQTNDEADRNGPRHLLNV